MWLNRTTSVYSVYAYTATTDTREGRDLIAAANILVHSHTGEWSFVGVYALIITWKNVADANDFFQVILVTNTVKTHTIQLYSKDYNNVIRIDPIELIPMLTMLTSNSNVDTCYDGKYVNTNISRVYDFQFSGNLFHNLDREYFFF